MRVGLEYDKSFLAQVVDDALDVLTVRAEVASEPGNRLWPFSAGDFTQDLPTGTGQPEPRNQAIAGGREEGVDPEQVEDKSGEGFTCWRSRCAVHLSSWDDIDMIMSI
jgi:hypothetical protein